MTRAIHDTIIPAFTAHNRRQAIPALYADGTGTMEWLGDEAGAP